MRWAPPQRSSEDVREGQREDERRKRERERERQMQREARRAEVAVAAFSLFPTPSSVWSTIHDRRSYIDELASTPPPPPPSPPCPPPHTPETTPSVNTAFPRSSDSSFPERVHPSIHLHLQTVIIQHIHTSSRDCTRHTPCCVSSRHTRTPAARARW